MTRDRYNRFIERHEVTWEVSMGSLALLWVAVGFLIDQVGPGAKPELEALEILLTGIFVAEFASRLYAAHDRPQYLRGHAIDAVALIPPVRALRVLRLLRLLRLVRSFSGFYRAAMHVEGLARHRGFAGLLVAWLGVMVICSAVVFAVEHGVNKLIDSPFDALWWGIATLTSVGYGDTYPITPEGRLAAMVLMLLGIGLYSAITATITSYLVFPEHRVAGSLATQLRELSDLREDGALTPDEYTEAKARVLGGRDRLRRSE